MPDARQAKHASFEEARSAFERLETKDKAAFVVEATFATLGDALQVAGRELGSVIEDLAAQAADTFAREDAPGGQPDAPPAGPPPVDPSGPEVGAPMGEAPGGPAAPPPREPD